VLCCAPHPPSATKAAASVDPDPKKNEAVMTALMEMRKIDIPALRRLADQA
jgi:hypothetical protein